MVLNQYQYWLMVVSHLGGRWSPNSSRSMIMFYSINKTIGDEVAQVPSVQDQASVEFFCLYAPPSKVVAIQLLQRHSETMP